MVLPCGVGIYLPIRKSSSSKIAHKNVRQTRYSNYRCAICRNKLTEPSIEYQASPATANEAGLSIAWGNCGHVYHLDCIQQWLKTRHTCPICGKEWDYAKIERILDGKGDEDASTEAK